MNSRKQSMSDKFQICCSTYTDDVDPAIFGCGKAVSKIFEIEKGQMLQDVASLNKNVHLLLSYFLLMMKMPILKIQLCINV